MTRVLAHAALGLAWSVGCAPPAQNIGAWTTAVGDTGGAATSSGTTGPTGETTSTSGAIDPTSSSTNATTETGSATSTGEPVARPWIAVVGDGAPAMLRVRALDGDGETLDVCALEAVPDGLGFLDDGQLVASFAATATIARIDPCDCTTTPIGEIVPPMALTALTELEGGLVFGADAARVALVTIDVDAATLQGAIDFADAPSITALAVRDDRRFALRAGAPMRLLELDAAAIVLADTALPTLGDAAGLTPSPIDDGLLACDAEGGLWHVDPGTGDVDPLAPALPGPCASLATPRGEIACLDALWLP